MSVLQVPAAIREYGANSIRGIIRINYGEIQIETMAQYGADLVRGIIQKNYGENQIETMSLSRNRVLPNLHLVLMHQIFYIWTSVQKIYTNQFKQSNCIKKNKITIHIFMDTHSVCMHRVQVPQNRVILKFYYNIKLYCMVLLKYEELAQNKSEFVFGWKDFKFVIINSFHWKNFRIDYKSQFLVSSYLMSQYGEF